MNETRSSRIVAALFVVVLLVSCTTPTPSPTPSPSPSPTPKPSPTPSPTPSPDDPFTEGESLFLHSDFAGALEAYQQAIAIDESYGPAYSAISRLYDWRWIKPAEILAQAQKGVDLAPESAFAHSMLAQAYIQSSDGAQAVKAAQRAVELEPKSALAQAALAQAYLEDNQFEPAHTAALKAYELDPQSAEALYALGLYYWRTADFARALAAYEQAAAQQPEFAGWQTEIGDLHLGRNQYELAAGAYERSLDLAPDYLPALVGLFYLDLYRYDYSSAGERITALLDEFPDEAPVHIAKGYYHLYQGEHKEALAQFNQALELNPESLGAREAIGHVYLDQQDCDRARSQYQDLEDGFPGLLSALVGQGFAELCAQDPTKALAQFREAAESDPYDSQAQTGMGVAYSTQARHAESLEAYLRALRLSPAPAAVHSRLQADLEMQGLSEEAQRERLIVLRLDPYSPETYLSDAVVAFFQLKLDQALESVKKALELDPTDQAARRFLGIIYVQQGQASLAKEALQDLMEELPDDPLTHLNLGYISRDQGDYPQAKKELETYLALMGETLEETSAPQVAYQIQALDLGYDLSDDEGPDEFANIYQSYLNQQPDVKIEEADGARTLVFTLPVSRADMESEAYLETMQYALYFAALVAPRIDPPVDNGLEIRLAQGGRTLYTSAASLDLLKMLGDSLVDLPTAFEAMDVDQVGETGQLGSIDQLTRDVAAKRELELQGAIPVETIGPDEVQAALQDSVDEQVRDSLQRDASLLTLLGVITPSLDLEKTWVDLYSEQVSGFYDPEKQAITLVERDGQADIDLLVLSHEAAHALQDQHFDLEALKDPELNDDQSLAVEALIEGDAMLADVFYAAEHLPALDRMEATEEASGVESDELESAPHFISSLTTFPYSKGLDFVYAIYQRDGWEGVNQVYADLPLSTEQILHPESYFSAEKPRVVDMPDISPESGWKEADRNVLGELELKLTLEEHLGPAAAGAAAEGWGGDGYLLLENESRGAFALLLRTAWDSPEEAEQFWNLYRVYMDHRPTHQAVVDDLVGEQTVLRWSAENEHVRLSRDDDQVTILIGPDQEAVDDLARILGE